MNARRFAVLLFLVPAPVLAQQVYTLRACIERAAKVSPDVVQAAIGVEQSKLGLQQARWSQTPDLTLSSGQFVQNGRTIDRFTNTFAQTQIFNNNFNLQSGVAIYNGSRARNSIQQARFAWTASEQELAVTQNNIALQVANFFLQALQAKELLQTATENRRSLQTQLDRAEKLRSGGALSDAGVLSLRAQLANEELNVVNAANQVEQALTSLRVLMQVPLNESFDISNPKILPDTRRPDDYSPDSLFLVAASLRPEIKAAEARVQSASYGMRVSKGALLPSLSFGANLSTVYSGNAKTITGTSIAGTRPIGFVTGTNEIVETFDLAYTMKTIPFSRQFQDNFGQSAGLQFSWALFNRQATRIDISRSRLDLMAAENQLEASRFRLYSDIIIAWTAYKQAWLRYDASRLLSASQEENLRNAEIQMQAGMSQPTELQVVRSAAFAARSSLIQARYETVFRRMILDFYAGAGINDIP
jgi:outer membrane protein